MDLGLISVRYARALLKAGIEEKLDGNVYQEMLTLSDSYINVPELKFTIDNPMLSKADKEQLFLTATGGNPCELTKRLFKLVLKEDRESVMQFIANSYITLYRKQKNLILAKLLTATTVSPSIEQKLRNLVESKTSGTVEFETKTNPDLIGGFVLEYDTFECQVYVEFHFVKT